MPNPNLIQSDIAVIGGGVIGCFIAAELASRGYDTCVLEKNAGPGHKVSCTGIVSRELLALIPAAKGVVQYEASSARIFSPSGKCIRVERREPQAYVLDRPALDVLLAKKAVEAGAHFYYSSPVVSVLPGDQSIQVFANCNLRQAVIKAKVVVIASGVGGSLTSSAGLGQISYLGSGAQTEVHCEHLTEVEVYSGTHIAPGFFAWLVPAGQSRAKAGLLCVGNPRPHIVNFLNRLRESGKISGATGEISLGAVPLRPLRKSYSERVLVAGDAAGQVKSTTGGGIYFGVLCAGMAVQTIGDALDAGDLSAKRLSSYHRKWQKVLKQELSIDYWAHRFYKGLSNRQIEHIFDVIERNGIHESILASPDITFDWHGKAVLDALKHRSLQRSLSRMYPAANLGTSPSNR